MEYVPEEEGTERQLYPIDVNTIMHRREAFRIFFGVAVAATMLGGSPAIAAGKKNKSTTRVPNAGKQNMQQQGPVQTPWHPEQRSQMEDAVEREGFLTTSHTPPEGSEAEAALNMPSLVPPIGFRLMPVGVTQWGEGNYFVLPCPRNAIDQQHVGTKIFVEQGGRSLQHETKVIYACTSAGGRGYKNPCTLTRVAERGNGPLHISALHWVNMPIYPPPLTEEQLYRYIQDPRMVHVIRSAMDAACGLKYDASVTTTDPVAAARLGRGNCRTKSSYARAIAQSLGMPLIEVAIGYSLEQSADAYKENGGGHWKNFVSVPSMFYMYGRNKQKREIGPQQNFVTMLAGTEHVLPDLEGEAGKRVWENINTGVTDGTIVRRPFCSVPGYGEYGAQMARLQPPEAIRQYSEMLWGERQRLYGMVDPRLSQR